MAYGLNDVVNQRRMIDESPAGAEFKAALRGKLDALLALAEATDCRRVRLLAYFDEASEPCGNCDNCLNPPAVWDATDAARKLLSTIYRVQQASHIGFGAVHLMDVLRQLVATGAVGLEKVHLDNGHSFETLALTDASRAVLRGEVPVRLREAVAAAPGERKRRRSPAGTLPPAAAALDQAAQVRFINLKAWRAEVAREHGLPAYVIFHNATLAAIAERCPATLADLEGIGGMGAKMLEAYGGDVLRVCGSAS